MRGRAELREGSPCLWSCPSALQVTVIRKPGMPVLQDTARECASRAERGRSARGLSRGGARPTVGLHPDLRHHPPGTERAAAAPILRALLQGACTPTRSCVLVATGLHRPNEGGELEELVGDRWVLRTIPSGEPLRTQRRGPCTSRHDSRRHRGQARPPLRGGRSQDRDWPGGTPFHGWVLRRPQGDRSGSGPRRDHHDLSQCALHVRPERRELRAGRQPLAPRAARDRPAC